MAKRAGGDKPGRGWFAKTQAAEAFGCSVAHFDRHYRQLAPREAIQDGGNRVWVNLRALIDAHVAEQVRKNAGQAVEEVADGDPLLAGAASPALERYRATRADLVSLELEQRRGRLVPRDEIRMAMGRLAVILRGAGETLQREYGADAQRVLDDALDDFEREIERGLTGE